MGKNAVLSVVIEEFPDLSVQITKQFNECENFQEICEDYVLCLNSIRKIESADQKKNENLKEFKKALQELEEELLSNVKIRLPPKNMD